MKFPFSAPQKASLILILLTLWAEMSPGQLCQEWSAAKQLGSLPYSQVNEASGLCLSRAEKGRAYWVNDSGNKARIYYGDLSGSNLRFMTLKGFKAKDAEAMTCTVCGREPCLILGDIGDNLRRRKSIQLAFFKDVTNPPQFAEPFRVLELTYPDGPHDAEALFIDEDGDLFIVTKELEVLPPKVSMARVYRVPRLNWESSEIRKAKLIHVGELPLPEWLKDKGFLSPLVTDASVNFKRHVLGLLTYGALIEIPLKRLTKLGETGVWRLNEDYSLVPIQVLLQQETVAYGPDDVVIWSTEFFPPHAPIFSMTCQRFKP